MSECCNRPCSNETACVLGLYASKASLKSKFCILIVLFDTKVFFVRKYFLICNNIERILISFN